jgi:hypothetical protein
LYSPQNGFPHAEVLHALSSRQEIDTMILKHGVATSDDVSALKLSGEKILTFEMHFT